MKNFETFNRAIDPYFSFKQLFPSKKEDDTTVLLKQIKSEKEAVEKELKILKQQNEMTSGNEEKVFNCSYQIIFNIKL